MYIESLETRVLIGDDHAVVRAGLRAVIDQQPSFVVVDEAQDIPALVLAVGHQLPDMVVMDLATQETSSLDAITDIKRRHPDTRILMLTGNRSRDYVVGSLHAGANGYVLKENSIPEFLTALSCVRKGQTYLCPEIAEFVISAYFHQKPEIFLDATSTTLSLRETQVLKLVATGNTSKQIADHLFISPRTVEKHRAHVMRKLNLKTMAALMTFVIGNNLIDRAEATTGSSVRFRQWSGPVSDACL